MRTIDQTHAEFRDNGIDDEPPLTAEERRMRDEFEAEQRRIERLFRED